MKRTILCVMLAAFLLAASGCANGPIRSFFRNKDCNSCPAVDPTFGFHGESDCPECDYGAVGAPVYTGGDMGDPYAHGSYYGGASISPPVFDSTTNPTFGGRIIPDGSSGTLPNPVNGQ
jgi:hypothetical protein